ncbi:hypothetical protein Leryth_008113 [Lithospermum erythrorhizon]|nr:hypothetical protein Leryth_008113 [Lithospermum erythrorhizon]
MDCIFVVVLLLATLSSQFEGGIAQPEIPPSHITIQGSVFCDVCHANTFSMHSYFLPGVDIHIECKFKANSPGTTEQISFSVNRTTNRHGKYKLKISSIEGVDCVEDSEIQSFCQARLIRSSTSTCNIPALKSTSDEVTIKSKHDNKCTYRLSDLSFTPRSKNVTLCGNKKMKFHYSLG